MKVYAETRLPIADVELLARVRSMVEQIDNPDVKISCHQVCALVVAEIPTLGVVRGYYFPAFEHSWLVTASGNIIDAYPVGSLGGGPVLIDRLVAKWHFHPESEKSSHKEKLRDSIRSQTEMLTLLEGMPDE